MIFSNESTRRLFIGLMPDAGVLAAIRQHCDDWVWPPGCRRTRSHRLHITLHFLGEVDAVHERALRASLHAVPMEPLELMLRTPQAWRRGGIAALLPDRHDGLLALHAEIGHAVRQAGLTPTPTRWFTPHVTLARQAAQADPPAAPASIHWPVSEFVLVWSRFRPTVSYEVLARYAGENPVRGRPAASANQASA